MSLGPIGVPVQGLLRDANRKLGKLNVYGALVPEVEST